MIMMMTTIISLTLSVMVMVVIKRGVLLYRIKLIESLIVGKAEESL